MYRCPKCSSEKMFMRARGVGTDTNLYVGMGIAMNSTSDWVTYLCTNCGYFENFITKREWLDKITADPQGMRWKKVE